MLPVPSAADIEQEKQKACRRSAAMCAYNDLAGWIDAERPDLRLPVGNLPRLWAALAVGNRFEAHVVQQENMPRIHQSADPVYRQDCARRLEALRRFHGTYRANLNAG